MYDRLMSTSKFTLKTDKTFICALKNRGTMYQVSKILLLF